MKRLNFNGFLVIVVFLACLVFTYYEGLDNGKQHNMDLLNQKSIIINRYTKAAYKAVEAIKDIDLKHRLSNIRIFIYKRQIKNLQAENDGLRTIINKDVKLKALIDF